MSKIFENAMHTQLMAYFTFHSLLASQQYGFRPNRSTELAALELMDRNINFMNQGFCPVNIYLDLSKAFDSPNYDILLSKLKFYGLQNNALQLLKSYLSDRSQHVQINNVKTNPHTVSCGIPPGSVLGPLLFNICINDIINVTRKFTLIMYADDTTLVSHLESFWAPNSAIEDGLNQEISKVNTWLLSNKLVLNVAKSKFMLFFKHPKIVPTLNLSINDNPIEQVTNFNFLGITIDQNITWNDHISKISIRVARVIGILNKLKHIFPHEIMRTIYNSIFNSSSPYLRTISLGLFSKAVKRASKESRKNSISPPLRISHLTPLFKNLKILKIEDQYSIQLYKLCYKNTNNLLPHYFNSLCNTL